MGKVLFGGIIGAIILFVWGFVSWMVLPWHQTTFEQFKNEDYVAWVIKENAPKDGVYMIPSMAIDEDNMSKDEINKEMAKNQDAIKNGPFIYAQIQTNGLTAAGPTSFVISFLTSFVGAVIICVLLSQTAGLHYFGRVFFVFLIGLLVGILGYIPNWNWFGASCSFTLVMIADTVISWFFAGLALAGIMKLKSGPDVPL